MRWVHACRGGARTHFQMRCYWLTQGISTSPQQLLQRDKHTVRSSGTDGANLMMVSSTSRKSSTHSKRWYHVREKSKNYCVTLPRWQ